MVITPDSIITLVHTDLSKNHQLTFSNISAQETYFESLTGLELQASTYQRKEGKVRFPAKIDDLINYNYLFFNNPSYTTKTYYCYITKMEYVNDGLTDVFIEIDVFQTFQFDFSYKRCFIEREHVNNDTIGLHTIPENLETGEFIQNDSIYDNSYDKKAYIIHVTKWLDGSRVYGGNLGGQYYSGGFYITLSYQTVVDTVQEYTTNTALGYEAIQNIYLIPLAFTYLEETDFSPSTELKVLTQTLPKINQYTITKPTTIDGYTPTNKKLLTYPYIYLTMANNNGSSTNLIYENFKTANCIFETEAIPTCGGSSRTTPLNYGNSSDTYYYQYGLTGGKYPVSDYIKDSYAIWLRQNMLNLNLGVAEGIINVFYGAIKSAYLGDETGIGDMISAPSGILGLLKQQYQHSLTPPTSATQTNISDLNISMLTNGFLYYKMSIKQEYAKIIDNYFTMYGYKILETKIPNITGRLNWNYVKTIDAIVEGSNIPHEYLLQFEAMLNNGITFWHNPSTFKDYSQSNTIVI